MRRRLNSEEQELWRRVAASVDPLRHRPVATGGPPPAQTQSVDRPQQSEKTPAESVPKTEASPPPQDLSTAPLSSGMDKRTAQRLRKGKISVDGRLDLHGMTQTQAHGALIRFIGASRMMNRRLVLVITGKGWDPHARRPEEAIGVLRRSVPQWLETAPLSQHVAAITSAHVRDGGTGAFYVLLRRSRRAKPRK